jgi:hypothetical protein
MSDTIAAGLITAIMGLIAAIIAATITILFAFRHDRYRRAVRSHEEYLSWLRGLIPECTYITSTIEEVAPLYQSMLGGGGPQCPTKHLNADFLGAARFGVMKHPRGITLFPPLTSAYRDVVHTNEMMTRFEGDFRRVANAGMMNWRVELGGILQSTDACMPSVKACVQKLLNAAMEQERLEAKHAPTFWDID